VPKHQLRDMIHYAEEENDLFKSLAGLCLKDACYRGGITC